MSDLDYPKHEETGRCFDHSDQHRVGDFDEVAVSVRFRTLVDYCVF